MPEKRKPATSECTYDIDFEDLFRVAPIGLAVLDPELRFVRVNELLCEMNGLAPEAHVGRSVAELLPTLAGVVERPFRSVFETGLPRLEFRVTGETPKAPGLRRTWVESVRPLKDGGGVVRHILVSVQEITALEEAEASLRETERTLRASQQLSPDSFTVLRAVRDGSGAVVDFAWEYANPAAQAALRAGPLVGRTLLELLPGNRDHPDLFPRYVRMLGETEPDEVELFYDRDGVRGWYRNSAVAIGEDRLAIGFRDITARKRAEEQLRLTSQEMRHRVKNVIAVVASLVSRSARGATDVPSYAAALGGRLHALAAAQDLLGHDLRSAVGFPGIMRAALGPYPTDAVTAAGPDFPVDASQAVGLTLFLNELATNAAKYGCLSVPEGRVQLTWTCEAGRATLAWEERGGPPVAAPVGEGFGTTLLNGIARQLPEGALHLDYARSGLEARLSFTVDTAAAAGPSLPS